MPTSLQCVGGPTKNIFRNKYGVKPTEMVTMLKNKPEEDSHHTFMQRTFTMVTSKALFIDVMFRQCRFDVNNKVLNWNCLAAWALSCHSILRANV